MTFSTQDYINDLVTLAATGASDSMEAVLREKHPVLLSQGHIDAPSTDPRHDGMNALQIASVWGRQECVRLLLELGADVNHRNAETSISQKNAIQLAAGYGENASPEVVQLLAAAGAIFDETDLHNRFNEASQQKRISSARVLRLEHALAQGRNQYLEKRQTRFKAFLSSGAPAVEDVVPLPRLILKKPSFKI